jgi:hypothetical protein
MKRDIENVPIGTNRDNRDIAACGGAGQKNPPSLRGILSRSVCPGQKSVPLMDRCY